MLPSIACGCTYGGRLIEGEIQERQQARQTYERARDVGQGAGLVEQQRANVFTTAVANIPPGETVTIEIEYQQDLAWQDSGFSLRLPLVVAPRYIPGAPVPVPRKGTRRTAGHAIPTRCPMPRRSRRRFRCRRTGI